MTTPAQIQALDQAMAMSRDRAIAMADIIRVLSETDDFKKPLSPQNRIDLLHAVGQLSLAEGKYTQTLTVLRDAGAEAFTEEQCKDIAYLASVEILLQTVKAPLRAKVFERIGARS